MQFIWVECLAELLHGLQEPACTSWFRAQADQETHLTFEVRKEGIRDGSAGKMLPCKHEDMSLVPKTHIKKLGRVFLSQHRKEDFSTWLESLGIQPRL